MVWVRGISLGGFPGYCNVRQTRLVFKHISCSTSGIPFSRGVAFFRVHAVYCCSYSKSWMFPTSNFYPSCHRLWPVGGHTLTNRCLSMQLCPELGKQSESNVSLSELQKLVMDREAWRAAIHGVTKSRTWLSYWTELTDSLEKSLKWWLFWEPPILINIVGELFNCMSPSFCCFTALPSANLYHLLCDQRMEGYNLLS